MPRASWLLWGYAALALCGAPFLVLAGGILGHRLSPSPTLQTLPIALFVSGSALAMYPVIRLMGLFGRKRMFMLAAGNMVASSLYAAYSITQEFFWGICAAAFMLGVSQSAYGQVRFAAMELAPPSVAAQAASRIMLAGLVAAIVGPELARIGGYISDVNFVGGFILLSVMAALAAVIIAVGYRNGASEATPLAESSPQNRWRNPLLWVAVVTATIAYGVMSLIMTATPLTMHVHHQFSLVQTKEVIQAHIIAMFLPSFFTGRLITKYGEFKLILFGLACYGATALIALWDAQLLNFWLALVLLGIGWNLMFVSATALLPKVAQGSARFRVQALNDSVVVFFQASASLGAGWLLGFWGWQVVVMFCLPLMFVCFMLVVYSMTYCKGLEAQ